VRVDALANYLLTYLKEFCERSRDQMLITITEK